LVGAPGGAMVCMMRNLEIERICLAAMSTGIARRCIETMCNYANDRAAFGHPINAYGQIQRHIGESYAEFQAGRAYLYNVSNNVDLSKAGQRVDSDGVKLYCSTMAKNVADRAIQVLGGNGYIGQYNVCVETPAI
jgi:isovaleryl-CoA dehydrogenase